MGNEEIVFGQERVIGVDWSFADPLVDDEDVEEVSAEGNLGHEVKEFGVHDEADQTPNSQNGRQNAQGQAHNEEGLGVSEVEGVNELRPVEFILVGPLDEHDEEDDDGSSQFHPYPQQPVPLQLPFQSNEEVFTFLFLLLRKKIHIENAEQEPVKVGRSSGPWNNIQCALILVIVLGVANLIEIAILVGVGDHHGVGERCQHRPNDGEVAGHFLVVVDEEHEDRVNEQLHVILEIPPPAQANSIHVVSQVVYEEQRFPHVVAWLNKGSQEGPVGSWAHVGKDPVEEQDGHEVGRYQS